MLNIKKINIPKRLIYILSFIIPFITVIVGLIAGGFEPFGSKDLLTAGGYDKIIPFFHEFYDRFHSGTLFQYSTRVGLGYDFTTVITYYLSDPTNFIVLLFPKTAMLAVLNLIFAVKVGASGLFMALFFSYRSKIRKIESNPFMIIALSSAYALSSYMMSYGINLSYTSAIALFPLIMMGIDKIFYEKKWITYAVSMTLAIYFNFYISMIIFTFSIIYLFILEYKDTSHCISTLLHKLLSDVLAFGASFIIIYNTVTSSFFKADINTGFYGHGMYSSFWNTVKMGLTRSLPYQLTVESNGVNIFVGTLGLMVILPFLMNKGLKLSYRVKNLLLLSLLIIACYSITSNYFFNFFYLNIEDKAFFGFIICFLLISICFDTLAKIDYVRQRYIGISFIISAAIVIMSMLFCTGYDTMTPFITSLEFLLFYLLAILVYKQKNISGEIFHILICLLLVFELISNSFISLKALGNRSEAYEQSTTCTINRGIDYVHTVDPESRVFVYDHINSTSTPMSNMINGYDYIIAQKDVDMDSYLQLMDNINDYSIYKNPYSFSKGVCISKNPDDYTYNPSYPYTSANILAEDVFGSGTLFSEISGGVAKSIDPYTGKTILVFNVDETGEIYSNLIRKTLHFTADSTDESYIIPLDESLLTKRERYFSGEIKKLNIDSLDSIYNEYKNKDAYSFNDSTVFRILPISDFTKWSTDNGTISQVNISGDDLVCLKTDNNSAFNLTFAPNHLYVGAIVSLISLLIFVAVMLVTKKTKTTEQTDNKLYKFVDRHKDPIIIYIISSACFIAILMYTCCVPFGQKSFVSSDGFVQGYPLNTYLFGKLYYNDLSLLNYQIGFGIDNFVLFFSSLVQPFTWIMYIFKIPVNIFTMNLGIYSNFILVFIFMYLYLTKRPSAKTRPLSRLTIYTCVIAYSLSTYIIAYFPLFQGIPYLLPLVLLVTENLLYRKKVLPYILVMAYLMMQQNYSAFLLCEFLVLFFFITDFESVKDFFMKGFRFALSSILAAGIAAVGLLPFYFFTRQSAYAANDAKLTFSFDQTILKSLYDFEFLHVIEPVTDNDYRANTYCGLLLLLVLALYICIKKIKPSVRIRTVLLVLLLYFSYGNSLMNFILHGFHKQVMVPNRFSLYFIVLLILIFIEVIENFKTLNTKKAIISVSTWYAILTVGFLVLNKSHYDMSAISTIMILSLYLALIIFYLIKKTPLVKKALLYLTIAEVMANAYLISFISIGQVASFADSSMEQTKKLAAEYGCGNDKLMKTELLNYLLVNGSCMTDVNSITYFSSITTRYQTDLSLYYSLNTGSNMIEFKQGNPLANLMLSVKYLMTSDYNDYIELPSYYDKVVKEGDVTLYENKYSLDPGIFIPGNGEYVPYQNLDQDTFDTLKFQNDITNNIFSKDIYKILDKDKGEVTYEIDEEESLDGVTNVNIKVSEDIEGYTYISYHTAIFYLGISKLGEVDEYDMDLGHLFNESDTEFKELTVGVLDIDNLAELHDTLAQNTATDLKYGFNTITGNINAPSNGTVYFSLPAYPTWEVYVDGQKTEWFTYMAGIGIPVESGNHSIKLVYHTLGLKEGMIISGVSILILLGYIFISKKKRHSNKPETKDSETDENISDDSEAVVDDSKIFDDSEFGDEKSEITNDIESEDNVTDSSHTDGQTIIDKESDTKADE